MAVDDWFYRFYRAHTARFPDLAWPDVETDDGAVFYNGLRSLFVQRGIHDAEVAEAASVAVMAERLFKVADHPRALHAAALEIYKARGQQAGGGGAITDRDSAALTSKACPYCDGMGLCVVYHLVPDYARRIPETVSAYCTCSLGRWIEANHRDRSPDVHKQTPNLSDVLAGRGPWLLDPPGIPAEMLPTGGRR